MPPRKKPGKVAGKKAPRTPKVEKGRIGKAKSAQSKPKGKKATQKGKKNVSKKAATGSTSRSASQAQGATE
eukprot:c29683_g1_i1 orf=162-374(+)